MPQEKAARVILRHCEEYDARLISEIIGSGLDDALARDGQIAVDFAQPALGVRQFDLEAIAPLTLSPGRGLRGGQLPGRLEQVATLAAAQAEGGQRPSDQRPQQ
jgi:hypothetical protein